MSFSDFAEATILNLMLRGIAATPPTSVWVALHTTAPDEDASPTNEVTGTGYVRRELLTSEWTAPTTAGLSETTVEVVFPTAGSSWGDVTHVSLWDASSGGNMWISGELVEPKTIGVGGVFRFTAAGLNAEVL